MLNHDVKMPNVHWGSFLNPYFVRNLTPVPLVVSAAGLYVPLTTPSNKRTIICAVSLFIASSVFGTTSSKTTPFLSKILVIKIGFDKLPSLFVN